MSEHDWFISVRLLQWFCTPSKWSRLQRRHLHAPRAFTTRRWNYLAKLSPRKLIKANLFWKCFFCHREKTALLDSTIEHIYRQFSFHGPISWSLSSSCRRKDLRLLEYNTARSENCSCFVSSTQAFTKTSGFSLRLTLFYHVLWKGFSSQLINGKQSW